MNKRSLIFILLAVLLLALLVGTASATPPAAVSGTYTFSYGPPEFRQAGNNCFIEVDGVYPFSGDLVGTAYAHFRALSHGPCDTAMPFANQENLYARGIFVGSVMGQEGTFDFVYEGRGWPADLGEQALTARIVVLTGTGDLSNLHGALDVTYTMGNNYDDYTGQMHFDP